MSDGAGTRHDAAQRSLISRPHSNDRQQCNRFVEAKRSCVCLFGFRLGGWFSVSVYQRFNKKTSSRTPVVVTEQNAAQTVHYKVQVSDHVDQVPLPAVYLINKGRRRSLKTNIRSVRRSRRDAGSQSQRRTVVAMVTRIVWGGARSE